MNVVDYMFVQSRERVRSPPHSDTSSSGSRGGESVSLASLGIAIGDRVVVGADSSRQPKVHKLYKVTFVCCIYSGALLCCGYSFYF